MFRFVKGAIHVHIVLPIFLHALFTAVVVAAHTWRGINLALPSTIVRAHTSTTMISTNQEDSITLYRGWFDVSL